MKAKLLLHITTCLLAASFFIPGCASTEEAGQERNSGRVFSASYDEVWAALEEIILKDLRCAPKKISKKKGIINTEWIYRIDTEGTIRWMIRARAKKTDNGVLVRINKEVEMRDEVSRNINKYRKESKDRTESRAGWKRGESNMGSVDDLYLKVENMLSSEQ